MAIDREWLNRKLAEAVLNQDLDEVQRLADYAVANDDEDVATDIHGRIIKPHRDTWGA